MYPQAGQSVIFSIVSRSESIMSHMVAYLARNLEELDIDVGLLSAEGRIHCYNKWIR